MNMLGSQCQPKDRGEKRPLPFSFGQEGGPLTSYKCAASSDAADKGGLGPRMKYGQQAGPLKPLGPRVPYGQPAGPLSTSLSGLPQQGYQLGQPQGGGQGYQIGQPQGSRGYGQPQQGPQQEYQLGQPQQGYQLGQPQQGYQFGGNNGSMSKPNEPVEKRSESEAEYYSWLAKQQGQATEIQSEVSMHEWGVMWWDAQKGMSEFR